MSNKYFVYDKNKWICKLTNGKETWVFFVDGTGIDIECYSEKPESGLSHSKMVDILAEAVTIAKGYNED